MKRSAKTIFAVIQKFDVIRHSLCINLQGRYNLVNVQLQNAPIFVKRGLGKEKSTIIFHNCIIELRFGKLFVILR